MHSLRLIFSVTALFFVTVACGAQVYSVNGTVVRTNDHAWILDSGSGRYGLVQFMDRYSADAPWITRTSVHFGTHCFTVRLPGLAMAVIGFLAVSSLVLLSAAVVGRMRSGHSHENAT